MIELLLFIIALPIIITLIGYAIAIIGYVIAGVVLGIMFIFAAIGKVLGIK